MKNTHNSTTPTSLYHDHVQKYVDEARKIKDNPLLHAEVKKAIINAGSKAVKDNNVYKELKAGHHATQHSHRTGEKIAEMLLGNRGCKHPQPVGYRILRKEYGNNPKYKDFFEKISYNEKGDLKMRNMLFIKNEYSNYLLTAPPNNIDVITGDKIDTVGQYGQSGVTYMSGDKGEQVTKLQGKKMFKTESEVIAFINEFPGKTKDEKIRSFVTLFQLPKTGDWNNGGERWFNSGVIGYIGLSDIDDDGRIWTVIWDASNSNIYGKDKDEYRSFLAFAEVPE